MVCNLKKTEFAWHIETANLMKLVYLLSLKFETISEFLNIWKFQQKIQT